MRCLIMCLVLGTRRSAKSKVAVRYLNNSSYFYLVYNGLGLIEKLEMLALRTTSSV